MAYQNKLVTEVTTIDSLKQIAVEIFLNHTDKTSKISPDSVLDAFIFSQAKLAQKVLKEVAINESRIFPDLSYGVYLDNSANLFGVVARQEASQSSAFVLIKANEGTQYLSGVNKFIGTNGIEFDLIESITIDSNGIGYGRIRSVQAGLGSNVDAGLITTVSPTPIGHLACTNEYKAIGGSDEESDESFKIRVKNHPNLVAKKTIDFLLEIIRGININVLRAFNLGISQNNGHTIISLVKENGVDLTSAEFAQISEEVKGHLALTDVDLQGNLIGIDFTNIDWTFIDIDFRLSIAADYDIEDVRRNIQIQISKYLDFRYWDSFKKVEWDDILGIVKNINGVTYVQDSTFIPNTDIIVPSGSLPRVRSFRIRDLDGVTFYDNSNQVLDVFYQIN